MPVRVAALLLAVVTFAGGARFLQVGHLSDDWAIVSHVSRHGNAAAWTGSWLGMETLRFHRPVFTALYDLEFRLFGTDPLPAHIHHLLWHVFAVLLLHRVLLGLGADARGAWFGALVFSIHPYVGGATGWLAGRCGTVAGTFTLATAASWLAARSREGGPAALFRGGAVVSAALAALTRESGYFALVVPLTLDLVGQRPRPGFGALARRQALFALVGVALLALRFHALGTVGGGYPEPDGLLRGASAVVPTLRQLGIGLLRLAGGIPPEFLDGPPIVAVVSGIATAVVVGLGLRAGRSEGRNRGGAALALLGLIIPQLGLLLLTGPELAAATGQRWYFVIAATAGLVGLGAGPLLDRRHLFAPLLLLPALVYGHLRLQGELVDADRQVKRLLDQTWTGIHAEKAVRDGFVPKAPFGPIFVSGLPESRRGLPTMHWGFSEALRPPFKPVEPPTPIYPVHRWMYLGKGRPWPYHPPLEPLLHTAGKYPIAFGVRDPWAPEIDELIGADIHTLVESLGRTPATWPFFADRMLVVREPQDPTLHEVPIGGRPLRIRLVVETADCTTIELFVFLPTMDARVSYPVAGPTLEVDLGPWLGDYLRFRGTEMRLYVVAVGHRAAEPEKPRISYAVTWLFTP